MSEYVIDEKIKLPFFDYRWYNQYGMQKKNHYKRTIQKDHCLKIKTQNYGDFS